MFNSITGRPFSSFSPYFRVADIEDMSLEPLMQAVVNEASFEPMWSDFGWSRSNDLLVWRSTFDDDKVMADNFARAAPIFDRLLAGPLTLEKFEFEVPNSQMSQVMDTTQSLANLYDPTFFSTDDGESKGYFRRTVFGFGDVKDNTNRVMMKPEFAIADWALTEPLLLEMMDIVKKQLGCVDFRWNKAEDKLQARGTFDDGAAIAHFWEEATPILDKMKNSPACKLSLLEFHGPARELEKMKPIALISEGPLEPQFFEDQFIEPEAKAKALPVEGSTEETTFDKMKASTKKFAKDAADSIREKSGEFKEKISSSSK